MAMILKVFYGLSAFLFLIICFFTFYLTNLFFREISYEESLNTKVDRIIISRGAGYFNDDFRIGDGGDQNNESFLFYLNKGDSIVKHANSDTIYVYRNSQITAFEIDLMQDHPQKDKRL